MAKGQEKEAAFVSFNEIEISESKVELPECFANYSLETQLLRDIDFLSLAIAKGGHSESDRIKRNTLLKSVLLLYFANICYRNADDQQFHPWKELTSQLAEYSVLTAVPIAAVLLHGSRCLIEFPKEITANLMDWLIVDKMSWRHSATHGISVLDEAEVLERLAENQGKNEGLNFGLSKCLKEEKVSITLAAVKCVTNTVGNIISAGPLRLVKNFLSSTDEAYQPAEHYGIDLALGGVGNIHFISGKIIQNNGEHGHLYVNCYAASNPEEFHSGLLLGIEQSAPSKSDQYGGTHDILLSKKSRSASGGDLFCKPPFDAASDYKGLKELPIADYYDSLWNFISIDTFALIKRASRKMEVLLELLEEDHQLALLREIFSSSGNASEKIFNQLFERYLQEIPQVKQKLEKPTAELKLVNAQIAVLKRQHEARVAKLTNSFMKKISHTMGWFSTNSQKKKLLHSLQSQLEKLRDNFSVDDMVNLLKNFMGICLMNRFQQKNYKTASAKACLSLLSLPEYQELSSLLFPAKAKLIYDDLLHLIAVESTAEKRAFYSVAHQQKLYASFYKEVKLHNRATNHLVTLAMRGPIYKP